MSYHGVEIPKQKVAEFCRRRFPALPTVVVPVFVDRRLFHFQAEKRLQIAFSPRKRPMEAAFIRDLFCADHPEFRNIPWVEIAGVSEHKVADILKHSAIYLSLCRFEALPLSILEAFVCGCVTAGFTGFGACQTVLAITRRRSLWDYPSGAYCFSSISAEPSSTSIFRFTPDRWALVV